MELYIVFRKVASYLKKRILRYSKPILVKKKEVFDKNFLCGIIMR